MPTLSLVKDGPPTRLAYQIPPDGGHFPLAPDSGRGFFHTHPMKNEYQSYDDLPEPSKTDNVVFWVLFSGFLLLLGLIGGCDIQ